MKKYTLKKIAFILCFTITISAINPITKAFANSTTIDINQAYKVSHERETFVEKYSIESSTGLPKFDIDRATKDGVSKDILKDAEEFNSSIEELEQEIKTRAGKTYFKKVAHKKWEIGLSSAVCKVIINGLKFGGEWLISRLTALIPGIGWLVSYLVEDLLGKGADFLKKYTKTGVKIIIMQHIYGSGWSFTYRQQ